MNGTIDFNYWVGFVNLRRKITHNIFHFFANLLISTLPFKRHLPQLFKSILVFIYFNWFLNDSYAFQIRCYVPIYICRYFDFFAPSSDHENILGMIIK